MNPILERQTRPQNLRKVAAQRVSYTNAKTIQGWQIVLTVGVATLLTVLAIWYEAIAGIVALCSIGLVLIDFIAFEPAINKLKMQGAQIQESFDCAVLDIDCAIFKATDPEIEDVLEKSDAIMRLKEGDKEKIEGWYSEKIEPLPPRLARLVCQRSNFKWDTGLRKRYIKFLWVPIVLLISSVFIASYAFEIDFNHFVLVVASVLPALVFFFKQKQQNNEAVARLDELAKQFNEIWRRINEKSISDEEIDKVARQLQDEIYQHRMQSPLVPDFYYKIYRDTDEDFMNRAVQEYVATTQTQSY